MGYLRSRELCHTVLCSDDLRHNTAEIAFPQAVELQYVEVIPGDAGEGVGSLQVYGRMGECVSAHTFVELTNGMRLFDNGSLRAEVLDAKALQTESLIITGTVLDDASASTAAASTSLQLSQAPRCLPRKAQEQYVPSQCILPLRGIPQSFLKVLEPIAQYWQAVGMSVGTHWPECMNHYHADETFSPLISVANDLMVLLLESTSACPLSSGALAHLKASISLESKDIGCQPIPAKVGGLELNMFVRVVVAWMGLSAATRTPERRAEEFSLFALAAALVLCSSPATAAVFMRYGGVARCSQILSEHQNVPNSPYVRYASATLAMLAECCTEAVAVVALHEKSQLTHSADLQSPATEQQGGTGTFPTAADADPQSVAPDLEPPKWEAPEDGFVVPGFGRCDVRQLVAAAQSHKHTEELNHAGRCRDDEQGAGEAGDRPAIVSPSRAHDGQTCQGPSESDPVPVDAVGVPLGAPGRGTQQEHGSSEKVNVGSSIKSGSEEQGRKEGFNTEQVVRSSALSVSEAHGSSENSYSSDATSSLLGHTPSPEHSTGRIEDRSEDVVHETSAQAATESRGHSCEIEAVSQGKSGERVQGVEGGASEFSRSSWDKERDTSGPMSGAEVPHVAGAGDRDQMGSASCKAGGSADTAGAVLPETGCSGMPCTGKRGALRMVGVADDAHFDADVSGRTSGSGLRERVGDGHSTGDVGALTDGVGVEPAEEVREHEERAGKWVAEQEHADVYMDEDSKVERQRGAGGVGCCSSEHTARDCNEVEVNGQQECVVQRTRGAGDSNGDAPVSDGDEGDLLDEPTVDTRTAYAQNTGHGPGVAQDGNAADDTMMKGLEQEANVHDNICSSMPPPVCTTGDDDVHDAQVHTVHGAAVEMSSIDAEQSQSPERHELGAGRTSDDASGKGRKRVREDACKRQNSSGEILQKKISRVQPEDGLVNSDEVWEDQQVSLGAGSGKVDRDARDDEVPLGDNSQPEEVDGDGDYQMHEVPSNENDIGLEDEVIDDYMNTAHACDKAQDEDSVKVGSAIDQKDIDYHEQTAPQDACTHARTDSADGKFPDKAIERVCTGPTAAATAAVKLIAAGEQPPPLPPQRPLLVGPAVASHLKPLPQLICDVLRTPQARSTLIMSRRFLQHLALQEAMNNFENYTEVLIGKVQQGTIGFSDADEGILKVARALGKVCECLEVLCAPPLHAWWRQAPHAVLKHLPQLPSGDAAALRSVEHRGILLRCTQMVLLPAMIVNAIVEAGSALNLKERQSLERRLGTHFHVPLRVGSPSLLCCDSLQAEKTVNGQEPGYQNSDFFKVLLRTTEGFMILCHDHETCRQLSSALSSTPLPTSDGLPLLPRTPATTSAPENTLATQLAFLATSKNAWDSVVGTTSGTSAALQAMHALLHLTEDDDMCQMVARVLLATPAAKEWLQEAFLESVAMELACSPAYAEHETLFTKCPQTMKDRIKELSAPQETFQARMEAPFAPSLLHALCSRTLGMFASCWATFLCSPDSSIELSLSCKAQHDKSSLGDSRPPRQSLVTPRYRSQQMLWMRECVRCARAHQDDGINTLLTSLNANLPPLTDACLSALPRALIEWTSATPLCPGNAPEFVSLRHSARTRGKVSSALMLVGAALSDIPDGTVTPTLTSMHTHAEKCNGGGLGILNRAVGTAVTWVNSVRAATIRARDLAEIHNLSDLTGDLSEATMLLHHACGALCAAVGALLRVPSGRVGLQGSACMHVRWRVVCHMLLAAYHVIHWMPDNLQSLLKPPSVVTPPLATRHAVIATLQLWLTVQHPVCPLQQVMCAGTVRDQSAVDEISMALQRGSDSVKAWASPAAQSTILCVLGDICAPAWPASRGQADRKLSEMLPFGELRAAVAAACVPLAREIQALVHTCCVSQSTIMQAAFVRCVPRLLSCSESMGTWLLSPVVWDLRVLIGSGTPHLQVHRVHALLQSLVPMLSCPLVKAHMHEQKFEELLCSVLHRSVGAWTQPNVSDERCVALQAVCRVVVDGLRRMCDVKISMSPRETVAQRASIDLPASKHIVLVVCTLLECLPFLEGSSDAAAKIIYELVKGPPAAHVIASVRKGAQAAAQAFTAEERDALGLSKLAIATSGTSPLIYLAEQLIKRSETLRAHDKFVSTVPACATAADLMRHLETIPESADTASVEDANPQTMRSQRYAAAAAASASIPATTAGGRTNGSAGAAAGGSSSAAHGMQTSAGNLQLPLDTIGPLALAHEAEMSRFVEYTHLHEMPTAAGETLEVLPRSAGRGPVLASLMPSSLDLPTWRPSRPGAQQKMNRKQPVPPQQVPRGRGLHAGGISGQDVKRLLPTGNTSAVHSMRVSDDLMGTAAANVTPTAENEDVYSDLLNDILRDKQAKERAVKAAKATKVAKATKAAGTVKGKVRVVRTPQGTPVRPPRPPPAGAKPAAVRSPLAPPSEQTPPQSTAAANSSPVSNQGVAKTPGTKVASAAQRRPRQLAMAGILPANVKRQDAATLPKPSSAAPPPGTPHTPPRLVAAESLGATGQQDKGPAASAAKDGSMASQQSSTPNPLPPPPLPSHTSGTAGSAPEDVYSRSVPVASGGATGLASITTQDAATVSAPSGPSLMPPPPAPRPGGGNVANAPISGDLPPPPPRDATHAVPQSLSSTYSATGPGNSTGAPALSVTVMPETKAGAQPTTAQGIQDLLKDPVKLRQLLSDPRWASFFAEKLQSRLKPST